MIPASFPGLIFNLLRLRAGPQDLPHSVPLLYRIAALALVVDLIAAQMLEVAGLSPLRFIAAFATSLLLPWLVLRWRKHEPRYVQTMLALLGTGIVLSLLFLPMALWALSNGLVNTETLPSPQQTLFAWLILAMVIWKIVVTASIWRHAMDWPMAGGTAIALGLFIAEFGIDRLLFAATGT